MRAVKFDRYGDVNVLHVAEVEVPTPDDSQIRVRIRAAGLNPGEVVIRSGAMDSMAPAHFPEGQGTDLAGVVDAVGAEVDGVRIGDEVIGWSDLRGAQAEYAVLTTDGFVPKPDGMAWEQAAAIPVVGGTGTAVVEALNLTPGETLVVAGASGGVGSVVAQLALRSGARVIGTASELHHAYLRSLGVEPVTYSDDLAGRIRFLTPDGVAAFADCAGHGNVDLAVELSVPAVRINTIVDYEAASRVGAQTQGMYQLDSIPRAVASVTALVAANLLVIPVRATFPLERVREAYTAMGQPAEVGKVVLTVLAGARPGPAAEGHAP